MSTQEYGDFYLTDDLLQQWRAATDIQPEAEQISANTKMIRNDYFLDAVYAEFVPQIRYLQKSLAPDPMTIDNLCSYLHSDAVDWKFMQTTHSFFTRKHAQFNETTRVNWQKIKTLLDLRTNALAVHDKVQQARQTHTDIKKFEAESERLDSLMQDKQRVKDTLMRAMLKEGVRHRKYTHVYENGAMVPKFTNARLLSARLAALNRADVSE